MMTDQPARVTPAEASEVLRQAIALAPEAPLAERIAYYESLAHLLSRLAADINTPGVHRLAAEAWAQLAALAAQLRQNVEGEGEQR